MVLRALADNLRQDERVVAVVPRKVMGDLARALREYADFLDLLQGDLDVETPVQSALLKSDEISNGLRSQGFVESHTASEKVTRFMQVGLTIYVRPNHRRPLIIHPAFEEFYSALAAIAGPELNARFAFWHSASLTKFPSRDNGTGLIHYGIAFGFDRVEALSSFIAELRNILPQSLPVAPERAVEEEIQDTETESVILAKARIGQGRFRADLLNLWQGQCALTEVSSPELLRASHIKSWRDSNNRERLDAFNGLLLAVHMDALFDRALISFENSGEMLISQRLTEHERAVFGLTAPPSKLLLNVPHMEYMQYHRNRFGANEQKY